MQKLSEEEPYCTFSGHPWQDLTYFFYTSTEILSKGNFFLNCPKSGSRHLQFRKALTPALIKW